MLDCSVPCEGGAAFLVARAEIARSLVEQPAYIRGFGEYHDHGPISQSRDFSSMGARHAARQAFESARLAPADVRVAEIYDAFTINPIMFLEEMGLVAPGRGGPFFLDGKGLPGGPLPVNTYGGLLSFGHTGDSSGVSMIVEGALQTMGRAGARQVRDADVRPCAHLRRHDGRAVHVGMRERAVSAEKPLPRVNETTRPYWDAAREGRLLLERCRACATWIHYPRAWCVRRARRPISNGAKLWDAAGSSPIPSSIRHRSNRMPQTRPTCSRSSASKRDRR